jgi:hypothetical protein
MDLETLVNCFVAVYIENKSDKTRVFVIHSLRDDFEDYVRFIRSHILTATRHISFNGINFDAQINHWIIDNYTRLQKLDSELRANEISKFATEVITLSNSNQPLPYPPYKHRIKQLDLRKMNHWDGKAKMCSLKWIQYSMDWYNVEEMPIHHTTKVTTQEQLDQIIDYCKNDVLSTKNIYNLSKEPIKLRIDLSNKYGIDLLNASEPKIAKDLFAYYLCNKLNIETRDLKTMRTNRTTIPVKDLILPYLNYNTLEFNSIKKWYQDMNITPDSEFKKVIKYKGMEITYALGGVHGTRKAGIYSSNEEYMIITSDVKSYYPNLAIKNKWAPEHLPKDVFCDLYEWFYNERIKIPKKDPTNYVLKIILNSTYGLSSEPNCFLYDPQFTMQITVNGQLSLSLLCEQLSEQIPGIIPLTLNTDGLEMMVPRKQYEKYMEICKKWEQLTSLELEHDEYQKFITWDVNNYIAVFKEKEAKSGDAKSAEEVWNELKKEHPAYLFNKRDGKYYYTQTKCKGRFEWEDQDKNLLSVLHKNKSYIIIPKTIFAYLVDNVHPNTYLKNNTNILDYCAGLKVKENKGWRLKRHCIKDGKYNVTNEQKVTRYYISKSGCKLVKTNVNDNRTTRLDGKYYHTVLNNLNTKDISEVNMEFYKEQIYKWIDKVKPDWQVNYTQLELL